MKHVNQQTVHVCNQWQGPLWSWSHGSWTSNYLCNQWLSTLKLWVRIPLDTTLCDKVCQLLVTRRWASRGTPVSSTNKTDHHDIAVESNVKHNNHTSFRSQWLYITRTKKYSQGHFPTQIKWLRIVTFIFYLRYKDKMT